VTDVPLVIDSKDELLALHRMLLHAKFLPNDLDEFRGSPLIAAIERRLAQSLSTLNERWTLGLVDDAPHVVEAVEARIRRADDWWASATFEDRRQFVTDLVAPFDISERLLMALVSR